MIFTFIGDIHGRFNYYNDLIRNHDNPTIQVGDMGIGFRGYPFPPKVDGDNWFIRGNHDDPALCRAHPNHLGDYGFRKEWNLFYVAGALSVDKAYRTLGVNWWPDEEIDYATFRDKIIPLYEEMKPRIMVTHDCPDAVKLAVLEGNGGGWPITHTMTGRALQQMFEIHQPDLWVFGHYHVNKTIRMDGTRFECVDALHVIEVEMTV